MAKKRRAKNKGLLANKSIIEIINSQDSTAYRELLRQWSFILTDKIFEYTKAKCRTWYKVGFNLKNTPLFVKFYRKEGRLKVFGSSPNINIDKSAGNVGKYKKLSTKRNPVFVYYSTLTRQTKGGVNLWFRKRKAVHGKGGFWFTPKRYQPRLNGNIFYCKTARQGIEPGENGELYKKTEKPRKWPFPAAWEANTDNESRRALATPFFLRGEIALSDRIIKSPDFKQMLYDSFYECLQNNNIVALSDIEVDKLLSPLENR